MPVNSEGVINFTPQKGGDMKNTNILNLYKYKTNKVLFLTKDNLFSRFENKLDNVICKKITLSEIDSIDTSSFEFIVIDYDNFKNNLNYKLMNFLKDNKSLIKYFICESNHDLDFYNLLYNNGFSGVFVFENNPGEIYKVMNHNCKYCTNLAPTSIDETLRLFVKSYIHVHKLGKRIGIKVNNNKVKLLGEVRNIFSKNLAKKVVEMIAGVKSVSNRKLNLKKFSNITDDELERKATLYSSKVLGDEKHSLIIKVKKSKLVLRGRFSDILKFKKILSYCEKLNGVSKVIDKTSVSKKETQKYNKVISILEKKIDSIFEGVEFINIRMFGEFAEVSGVVSLRENRNLIEKYIQQSLPVKKVFNKIYYSKT